MSRNSLGRIERLESRTLLSLVNVGDEFRLNAVTANDQYFPRVAMTADGGFVAVWMHEAPDGLDFDVYARRYDGNGSPLGNEFLVNEHTPFYQAAPVVAADDSGDFVVAWNSDQNGASYDVYARRYNAAGQPQGGEFLVNTFTAGTEQVSGVAMDADGDFVVAWFTTNSAVGGASDVYVRRFTAQGQAHGTEVRVNMFTTDSQALPAVAMDDDGDFVVTWMSLSQDGSSYGVYARRFAANGQPQGGELRVNTYTTGNQLWPSVAMTGGGEFTVAWTSGGQDGSLGGIYARRYGAGGVPLGGEIQVNTYTPDSQRFPAAATDDSGNFLIVWDSIGPDGDGYGVMGRAFRADGSALGTEFRVSAYAPADQIFSALAMDEDGDAVAAWLSEGQDGSGVGAFARRYRLDEIAPVVVASLFRFQTPPHQLRFTFTENVSASLASADLTVLNVAGGPPIPTTLSHYDATTQTATFSFGQTLTDGQYRATLAATGITDAAGNPLAADHVFEFFFLTGDANHDGRVNLQDFNILASNFGQSNRDFTHGDFNFDQIVNLTDFNLLAGRFGQVLARDGSIVTAGQRLPRWPGGSSPRGSSDGFPGGTGSDTNAEDEWPIMA